MHQYDGHRLLPPTGIDIPLEIRLYVITLLQHTLACTVDLRSQVKQAGWNVKGHDFGPLHALFATMATALEAYTDLVAERLVVLGGVACGTTRTAARQSTLPEYPDTLMEGSAHVRALMECFTVLCHGNTGRHYAHRGCRGCGQCGALHRSLARGRPAARGLGSVPPPLKGPRRLVSRLQRAERRRGGHTPGAPARRRSGELFLVERQAT